MPLNINDLASADGPYLRADGTEVALKYLEVVRVIKTANVSGEVFVVGLDSKLETLILESSLTPWKERP